MANGVIGKVTAGGGTHLVTSTFYGTCATAANTAAKIVKLADTTPDSATPITGMLLAVKFTNANSAASPTLTVQRNANTTNLIAAKPIMAYGSTAAGTVSGTAWRAGAMILFVYDGTNWVITDYNDYSIHQNAAITTDGAYNLLGGGSANANEQVGSVNKLSGLTYNPSTNVLINTAATDKIGQIYLTSPSYSFGFLNGSGGTNHGIYDGKAGKWVLMANAEHQWYGNFNANGTILLNCTTAANTAKKVISYSPFNLQTGTCVYVTFSNLNTATNPSLNINGSGDKEIWCKGIRVHRQSLAPNFIYRLLYDGTYWQITNEIVPTVGTSTTAAETAAKAVTINGFIPYTGAEVFIKFSNTNTAASPTLSINGYDAKPILWMNLGQTKNNRNTIVDNIGYKTLRNNHVYLLKYDGTNYHAIDDTFQHYATSGVTAVAAITYTQAEYDQYVADNGTAPSWNVGDVKTAAVAEVSGSESLALGTPVASNKNGGMTGKLILYGPSTLYHTLQSDITGTSRVMHIPNYAGDGYLTHTGADTQLGSTTKPVYVAANGRITEASTYAGGTAVTLNNSSKAGSTATFYAPAAGGTAGQYLKAVGATSAPTWASFTKPVVTWTGGTSAGPTLKVTTDGGASDAVAVPSATGSASGIVTTGAQTFAGVKTFSSGISLGNDSSAYNTKGIVFTGGSRIGENSSKDLGIYGGGKIYIKPNSPAASSSTDGMILDGDGLYPVVTNTESLGKTDNKWSNVYATTVTLGRNPTANLEAATKQYVDSAVSGVTLSSIGAASATHSHGNVENGGTMSSTGVAIANGDYLLFSDASNSGKIERSSITFDGTTTTKALSQKGTWEAMSSVTIRVWS